VAAGWGIWGIGEPVRFPGGAPPPSSPWPGPGRGPGDADAAVVVAPGPFPNGPKPMSMSRKWPGGCAGPDDEAPLPPRVPRRRLPLPLALLWLSLLVLLLLLLLLLLTPLLFRWRFAALSLPFSFVERWEASWVGFTFALTAPLPPAMFPLLPEEYSFRSLLRVDPDAWDPTLEPSLLCEDSGWFWDFQSWLPSLFSGLALSPSSLSSV